MDCLILETFRDLNEMRAAVEAARERRRARNGSDGPPEHRGRRRDNDLHQGFHQQDLCPCRLCDRAELLGSGCLCRFRRWPPAPRAVSAARLRPHDREHGHRVLPAEKAGFRAGIYADAPPPIFDLRDIHIADLNLTLHMHAVHDGEAGVGRLRRSPRGSRASTSTPVRDPANSSYLYMDPTDPLVAKFYVRLAVAARRGTVRILDEGPRATFRLPRAARSAAAAPRSTRRPGGARATSSRSPTSSSIASPSCPRSGRATTSSPTRSSSICTPARCPARPPRCRRPSRATAPTPHLGRAVQLLGPALRRRVEPPARRQGPRADRPVVHQPDDRRRPARRHDLADRAVRRVARDRPRPHRRRHRRPARQDRGAAAAHPRRDPRQDRPGQRARATSRRPRRWSAAAGSPARSTLSATFGLKPLQRQRAGRDRQGDRRRRGSCPPIGPLGRFLQGRLRAIGDVDEGFELREFDLALGATPSEKALRVHHGRLFTKDKFGSIRIENVYADAGKSHARSTARSTSTKRHETCRIDGDFPDLDVWLQRFGLPALFKSAGGGVIVISGPLTRPTSTSTPRWPACRASTSSGSRPGQGRRHDRHPAR